jgi:hypothetical protein
MLAALTTDGTDRHGSRHRRHNLDFDPKPSIVREDISVWRLSDLRIIRIHRRHRGFNGAVLVGEQPVIHRPDPAEAGDVTSRDLIHSTTVHSLP